MKGRPEGGREEERCPPPPRARSSPVGQRHLDGTDTDGGKEGRTGALLPALMGPRGRPAALLLLLALAALRTGAERSLGKAPSRNRRGVIQLAGAVQCTTGRTPLAYLHYGCYCGLGGSGWPNDRVDWCCFKHDCCYSKAEKEGCGPKTEPYNWTCEDNEPQCDDLEDKCQKLSCECDREAATCLAKAPYHLRYIFWPESMCGAHSPKCKDD
uniref:Phospholipase A2 n=1 Tax=Pogona vitticeps TaxID=103695 RepID=A0A6J0UXQ0_9SAUR